MIGSVPDPGIHGLGALHKLLSFPDAVSSPVNCATLVPTMWGCWGDSMWCVLQLLSTTPSHIFPLCE